VTRRRIYLLRHAAVSYFENGRPVRPDDVRLTPEGLEQARRTAETLRGVPFDRVITSGLRRTVETARLIAPELEPEEWPELREIESGRLAELEDVEAAFLHAFPPVAPEDARFLGGETIGSLLDRVFSALDRLLSDPQWDTLLAVLHGGVNRAIISHALTGDRTFLGNFEQAPACINILDVGDDWVVRAVNIAPYDLLHADIRTKTMEELWAQYRNT